MQEGTMQRKRAGRTAAVVACALALGCGGIAVDDDYDADADDEAQAEELEQADDAQQADAEDVTHQEDAPGEESTPEDIAAEDAATEDGAEDSETDEASCDLICLNTCDPLSDQELFCNDGGPGSSAELCDYGTDCDDCGPRCYPRPPVEH